MTRDGEEFAHARGEAQVKASLHAIVRGKHHGGIFPPARIAPPLPLSRMSRWLDLALRAEAARCLEDRTFTDEEFSLYREWSRRGSARVRSERPQDRTVAELWKEHEDVWRVFWLLDAARMLPFFGNHSWGPFSMLTAYERRRVYPVVLPMWTPIDRARMRLAELCWRDWGPFAHESYTATFLGNGTQCAVLDHLGVALHKPEDIFNERQACFLSDLIDDLRHVIASRENLADEPDVGGVPDWVRSSKAARPFYAQLHRAAGQVWAHHVAHRRCACGARPAREQGGNPSATCGRPACRTEYERRRKNARRIAARLAAYHREHGVVMPGP
jgi:hypothetical protein